jgi:hypothetical protein
MHAWAGKQTQRETVKKNDCERLFETEFHSASWNMNEERFGLENHGKSTYVRCSNNGEREAWTIGVHRTKPIHSFLCQERCPIFMESLKFICSDFNHEIKIALSEWCQRGGHFQGGWRPLRIAIPIIDTCKLATSVQRGPAVHAIRLKRQLSISVVPQSERQILEVRESNNTFHDSLEDLVQVHSVNQVTRQRCCLHRHWQKWTR